MAEQTNYLAETILTVQNEIQSSLNWMETHLRPSTDTQTDVAETFMSLSNINVKLPLLMNMEQNISSLSDVNAQIAQITDRKGLLIKDNGDGTGVFTKIKVQNPDVAITNPLLIGILEITFSPVDR